MNLTSEQQERAITLLLKLLTSSNTESEFDKEIYHFLTEVGEIPLTFIPYWMMDDVDDEEEYDPPNFRYRDDGGTDGG